MTTRVTLISPARSVASEEYRFDDGRHGLSPAGERDVRRAREAGGTADGTARVAPRAVAHDAASVVVSPSVRCVRTAEALGIEDAADRTDDRLAGCAMGRWSGRTLDEVGAREPEAVARWLADPEAAPHGGESVARLCARTAEWLDGLVREPLTEEPLAEEPFTREPAARERAGRARSRHVLAVAEPDVVRAAVLHALGAPATGLWRVDVAPLTAVELTGRAGRWNLRAGTPLGSGAPPVT